MLKILNSRQIKELDSYTIANEPIASIDLMERACRAFITWFIQHYDATHKIGIVCGTGNNGGDGLGIARMLTDWNYFVKVWVVRGDVKETDDFKTNLKRLPEKVELYDIELLPGENPFTENDILIDAIFGSGLSRPVEGIYAHVIKHFNETDSIKVAVDIPSGLRADVPSSGEIIKADRTVVFQIPKLAFFFPENYQYVGKWNMVDIGLSKAFLKEVDTSYFYLTRKSVRKKIIAREKFSHKGDFGRALLIAGSLGKMGASVLAARAVMRSGAGLLTVHVPKCGYTIIQTAVPEAMASVDKDENCFSSSPDLKPYNAIGIGPGIGTAKETVEAFSVVLESGKPLVIDADGLNILSAHRELLHLVQSGSILTPHPGEFARLVGEWKNDFERLELQIKLAKEINSIIVLKGAHTSIVTPQGKVYFNSTGNPGMATGGSGDVLTGILSGLLAQDYSPEDTAVLGVFLHGLAGDMAASEKGTHPLIANDLVDFMPAAYNELLR